MRQCCRMQMVGWTTCCPKHCRHTAAIGCRATQSQPACNQLRPCICCRCAETPASPWLLVRCMLQSIVHAPVRGHLSLHSEIKVCFVVTRSLIVILQRNKGSGAGISSSICSLQSMIINKLESDSGWMDGSSLPRAMKP